MSFSPVQFVHNKNVTDEEICANIRANAGRPLPFVDFKRVAVCASGPSLADHIEDIRARQQAGWHIATMNGSHNFLIGHGIWPDLYFQIDSRFGNLPFLDEANLHTTYVIASQCKPEIFEALEGHKVLLWQVHNYDGADEAIQEATEGRPCPIFLGASNVGQSCFGPLLAMGYRVWHLFGFDGSMRGAAKHAFDQPQNTGEPVHEFIWPMTPEGEPIEGMSKTYCATPTMAQHAATMPERITQFRKLGIEIEVFGGGLLPDMVAALASRDGAVTVPKLETPKSPPPKPRTRPVEKLQVVCWKWKGHIPYFAEDVNVWARMVDRWLDMPSELVCITDDPADIDGGVRIVPLWRDHFEHGRDWHRLKIFAPEMADIIGPRFVSIDLDTVICGPLDPLFGHEASFKAWQDPNRSRQYCTALFQMDAGAYPHVLETFDAAAALSLRNSGKFTGYDQAWISQVLPGQPMWTRSDGVLSFKGDILKATELRSAPLPLNARVINFHGKFNPRDPDVQAACPWIADYYR